MEMSDRRASLLEEIADLCRREMALEEAKKDSAAEFNDQIKAIKNERERLLSSLDQGADPTELPFTVESKYPTLEEIAVEEEAIARTQEDAAEESERDIFDDALELTEQAVDANLAAEEEDDSLDPGNFFE